MSRCPPPLGPMCWGGRSSICRASSPMVSPLPRQEGPHGQKRSVSWGAGPAGPGELAGQRGTRCPTGPAGRRGSKGDQRQPGLRGREQVNKTALIQLRRLRFPDGSRMLARFPDAGPCHPYRPKLCLEAGARGVCSEQSGPVTSVSAVLFLQQEASFGSFLGSFSLFPLRSRGGGPHSPRTGYGAASPGRGASPPALTGHSSSAPSS